MKKLVLLGCLLMIAMSCRAQTIVPVEKSIDYMIAQKGIPKGTYLKDINNLFGIFTGTWKGTFESKNYTFIITKFKDEYLGLSEDKLLIRYLITTSNGDVIEDTRALPDASPDVIEGDHFSKGATHYALKYFGKNSGCGQKGTVFIWMKKNTGNTEMSLTMTPDKFLMTEDGCPGLILAEQLLPVNGMVLTKQ